jgi:hypothetical protein
MIKVNFSTKTIIFTISLLVIGGLLSFVPQQVLSIEYGGIGGVPAYPDRNNERSKSIFILEIPAGTRKSNGILVSNNNPETKTIWVYPADGIRSSDGSLACTQKDEPTSQVGSWITMRESEITLEPYTSKLVEFAINVPRNSSVGEHNGCIVVQEKKAPDPNQQSGIALSFRAATRIAITVPGDKVRELEIIENKLSLSKRFTDENNDKQISIIRNEVTIKNLGNVSIDTAINISLQNVIFRSQKEVVNNNYSLFRETEATYNFEYVRPFWGGIYKSNLTVSYDASNKATIGMDTDNEKTNIFQSSNILLISPHPIVIVSLILLICAIAGLVYYVKFYKKK